jgi:hypothetical protein
MGMRIKVGPRAPLPNRWKWEIMTEEGKSVTASQLSYGERGEAYDVGQAALAEMVGKEKPAG